MAIVQFQAGGDVVEGPLLGDELAVLLFGLLLVLQFAARLAGGVLYLLQLRGRGVGAAVALGRVEPRLLLIAQEIVEFL